MEAFSLEVYFDLDRALGSVGIGFVVLVWTFRA